MYGPRTRKAHAVGNQVPSAPDAGDDRLALRRLAGMLAWWLDQRPALVPGDGSPAHTLKRQINPLKLPLPIQVPLVNEGKP
jgi:hypothetical protein